MRGETHEWKGWSFKMRQYTAAVDEELYLELVNVEANPLREMPLAGMNEPQKRRARQLAFMLTMHTKDRATLMITRPSDPASGFEIWRRFLEEWEPAHRKRYPAMLMQLLQFPFMGDRDQALEEWERLVRQYEAQSSGTLQDTIKAAILAHNPQDPEWRSHVGLNATRQREGQRERQSKEQRQAEGRNIRHVEYEVFLLQGEMPRPKGLSQVLRLAR